MSTNRLEGKIALVTGGTSGIGLAAAKRFVAEGAWAYITGRRPAELEQAIRTIGKNVTGVQGDVSNLGDLDRLHAQIDREKGRLDVLFANAGGGTFAPLGQITEEHCDRTFNINVKGLVFTVQKALPLFKQGARSFSMLPPPRRWARPLSASTARPRPRCGISPAVGFWT